jgi:hypothetical protein
MEKHVIANDAKEGKIAECVVDPGKSADEPRMLPRPRFEIRWWDHDPDAGAGA